MVGGAASRQFSLTPTFSRGVGRSVGANLITARIQLMHRNKTAHTKRRLPNSTPPPFLSARIRPLPPVRRTAVVTANTDVMLSVAAAVQTACSVLSAAVGMH